MTTYYDILGVAKDCSEEEIKQAYHRLAMLYHPDKNSSPEAGENMRRVNEAYRVLSDPGKRAEYDTMLSSGYRYGDGPDRQWTQWQQRQGPWHVRYYYWSNSGDSSGWRPGQGSASFGGGAPILSHIFNSAIMGLLCGVLFFVALVVSSGAPSAMNAPVFELFLTGMVVLASPLLAISYARKTIRNSFEAKVLGAISLSLALITSLFASIYNHNSVWYYAFACCLGPWACILAGWILGSRLGVLYYALMR